MHWAARLDDVVPLTMELVTRDIQRAQILGTDLLAREVLARSMRARTTSPRQSVMLIKFTMVSYVRRVALRTRATDGDEREVFAVVGPRYTPHDIDQVAAQVSAAVPHDARADVLYDGYRARMNVLFHSDIRPDRCVAGEIFKAGILVTTADEGSGAIRISPEVWRNLCRNLIILDYARVPVATRRPSGAACAAANCRSGNGPLRR